MSTVGAMGHLGSTPSRLGGELALRAKHYRAPSRRGQRTPGLPLSFPGSSRGARAMCDMLPGLRGKTVWG